MDGIRLHLYSGAAAETRPYYWIARTAHGGRYDAWSSAKTDFWKRSHMSCGRTGMVIEVYIDLECYNIWNWKEGTCANVCTK